MKADFCFMS